ncbi:MAG: hypothetical protein EOP61_30665, partial [Sphingomonadales bacterium]
VTDKVVVAGRLRLGTIVGADLANIAPSRRLYSGGGGSVRGYGYQRIGPRDASGNPTGHYYLVGHPLVGRTIELRAQVIALHLVGARHFGRQAQPCAEAFGGIEQAVGGIQLREQRNGADEIGLTRLDHAAERLRTLTGCHRFEPNAPGQRLLEQ